MTKNPNLEDKEISEHLQIYRRVAERNEKEYFHSKAAFSKDHSRCFASNEDYRLPYKRDVDRILHSKAYMRYADKTQVMYLIDNDHITHRSLHVQLVSGFARGIAEILRLNVDLVEAIALGHDGGHPPFGHEGETYLSALSEEYGNGSFVHSHQSCRLFSDIEQLNLGLAVYDGFLCHDGSMKKAMIVPFFHKTWDIHFKERENKHNVPNFNPSPMSLEGCLVKICDTMSYVGKDIEDAINLKILSRQDVPKTVLGTSNKSILSVLAKDLIGMSYDKDYITLSEPVFAALKELRAFNFKHVYTHPKLKVESHKVKRGYRILFETLLFDYQSNKEKSYMYENFLKTKSAVYLEMTSNVQMVVDYIAGMTDGYFVKALKKLVIPSPINLT